MNEQQYERVKGAMLFARAMGATITGARWGVSVVVTPEPIVIPQRMLQIGDPDEQLRSVAYKAKYTKRWASETGCMCPMGALLVCEQPDPSSFQIEAAADLLGVRHSLVQAFTCGWDGTKAWKGDAVARELVPEMATWYAAGVRMREEYWALVRAENEAHAASLRA